jgi:dienelactone hydrolase
MRSEEDVGSYAQRQAEQLHRAALLLDELGVADVSRSAAVGHSFGARAALLLAMEERKIKALVSLDGGIGTAQAIESFRRAAWFDAGRATVPILHFYETADPFMAPDFNFLRTLPLAELTLREVRGLHHVDFTTLGFGAAVDPRIRAATGMDPEGPASLRAVATELAAFLARYVLPRAQ